MDKPETNDGHQMVCSRCGDRDHKMVLEAHVSCPDRIEHTEFPLCAACWANVQAVLTDDT